MNRETLSGDWMKIKGLIHTQWGKLTDDDLMEAQGRYESLVGAIQKHYNLAKDKAEEAVNDFLAKMKEPTS